MKYWFVFKEDNVLLERLPNGSFTIPQADTSPIENATETHVLRVSSMADGTEVRAVSVNTFADNPRYEFCGLRASYYKLPLPSISRRANAANCSIGTRTHVIAAHAVPPCGCIPKSASAAPTAEKRSGHNWPRPSSY